MMMRIIETLLPKGKLTLVLPQNWFRRNTRLRIFNSWRTSSRHGDALSYLIAITVLPLLYFGIAIVLFCRLPVIVSSSYCPTFCDPLRPLAAVLLTLPRGRYPASP